MISHIVVAVLGWVVLKVLIFKWKNPKLNWLMAFLDTGLTPLRFLNVGPFSQGDLTIEKAMKAASESCGLTDFGDLQFIESYKIVTSSPFFKKLRLTNIGYLMCQKERLINFTKKLKVVDYLKRAPQIEKVPIKSPIVVFGLGRSGTTFVHRLISLDPSIRSPRLWEELMPYPNCPPESSPDEFAADRAKRLALVKEKIAERERMGQSAMAEFHEIGAELPEEDMMGLSADLPVGFQELFSFLCAPGGFADAIKGDRVKKAYANYKRVLQLLSFQTGELNNERQWAIKFPVHILYLEELAQVFPDCKLVWAHRHPIPTASSLAAMMTTLRSIYYSPDTLDKKEIGRSIKELCEHGLPKATRDIKKYNIECAHVIFDDLVNDPISVVKNIYKQFGMKYTQEFEDIMKAYMMKNNAERAVLKAKVEAEGREFDVHYPETYGMTKEELSTGVFAEYLKKYNMPKVPK